MPIIFKIYRKVLLWKKASSFLILRKIMIINCSRRNISIEFNVDDTKKLYSLVHFMNWLPLRTRSPSIFFARDKLKSGKFPLKLPTAVKRRRAGAKTAMCYPFSAPMEASCCEFCAEALLQMGQEWQRGCETSEHPLYANSSHQH